MAREKSIKVRLTETEDKFLTDRAEELKINRSEYVRRLIQKSMEESKENK